jgi:hypothetical protein
MRAPALKIGVEPQASGSIMVIALLVMALLSLLGMTLLTVGGLGHTIAYNSVWSEGALFAADAGVQRGISQLSQDPAASTQAIPVTALPGNYTYRSGGRSDAGPQPPQYVGDRILPGYAAPSGVGYGTSGYVFNIYQINATGTGPRNALREIEVRAEYGPTPR